jgi:hypothetical protein
MKLIIVMIDFLMGFTFVAVNDTEFQSASPDV